MMTAGHPHSLRLEPFQGQQLAPHLDALGELRIRVFREFPYLYEGSLAYERDYLQTYLNTPDSLVILALDGERPVGATTCLPMHLAEAEFRDCFEKAGYDTRSICYFGESILLPEYRGLGVGKAFFEGREKHARKLGARLTTFCAVDRSADHPRRPPGYQPLDAFWTKQGYTKRPELQTRFEWKEIGQDAETTQTLTFWTKEQV